MVVNLLARQFGVVAEVLIKVPNCGVHDEVFLCPRITRGGLAMALVTLGNSIGGGQTKTSEAGAKTPTIAVHVGPGTHPRRVAVPAIAVAGNGWRALARTTEPISLENSGSAVPIGPQFAACIAAGFCFKAIYEKQADLDADFD